MTSTLYPTTASAHGPAPNAQLERTVSHLERSATSISDPHSILPSLYALLKDDNSKSLTVRIQRLIRQIESSPSRNIAQATKPSTTMHHHQLPSTSAMGRFLYDSIQVQSHQNIRLPPKPRFIVDANIHDKVESSEVGEQQAGQVEDEDPAEEYEAATYELRRRRGKEQQQQRQSTHEDEKGVDSNTQKHISPSPSTTQSQPPPSTNSDRATHENLSSELLRMASALRSQSISFSEALERDRKLLESTDEHLAQNLDLMTRTRGKLGEYAHKARGMGWLTLGTIVVVILIWIVMFVIIKLT